MDSRTFSNLLYSVSLIYSVAHCINPISRFTLVALLTFAIQRLSRHSLYALVVVLVFPACPHELPVSSKPVPSAISNSTRSGLADAEPTSLLLAAR